MAIMVGLDPDQYLHALDQKDRSGESQGGAPGSNRIEGDIIWFIGGAGNSFSLAVVRSKNASYRFISPRSARLGEGGGCQEF